MTKSSGNSLEGTEVNAYCGQRGKTTPLKCRYSRSAFCHPEGVFGDCYNRPWEHSFEQTSHGNPRLKHYYYYVAKIILVRPYRFWTYILTNFNRTVLYTGVTNNLARRLVEHWIATEKAFTTRYNVHYLVYSEETKYVLNAIDREKQIKLLRRSLKESLVTETNPDWKFQNADVLGNWPPTEAQVRDTLRYWDDQARQPEPEKLFFHRQLFERKDDGEPNE